MLSKILTKDDKINLVNALRDFVIRVASETNNKQPEEVAVLPAVAGLLLINEPHWTGLNE